MPDNDARMLLDRYLRWSRDIKEARRNTDPHQSHSYLRGRRDEARDQYYSRTRNMNMNDDTFYLEGRADEKDQIAWLQQNETEKLLNCLSIDTTTRPLFRKFQAIHDLLDELAARTEEMEERLEMEEMSGARDDLACRYDEQAQHDELKLRREERHDR
jgi:hypothetical protein